MGTSFQSRRGFIFVLTLAMLAQAAGASDAPSIALRRVPNGGIQPQAAVDAQGTIHLIYFKGDPAAGDLFYTLLKRDSADFPQSRLVNSHPGSAIAIGTIRGAQMAIGKAGRVHVAWNGSKDAQPRGPKGETPMLYTRFTDDSNGFEPQRNVIERYYGLDGGGSVAADDAGNVYVAWHAPEVMGTGEANRKVWVARSTDDGKTFSPETVASAAGTGACGCCGLRIFAEPAGKIELLYRSARESVNRDMYQLTSTDHAAHFASVSVSPMTASQCVMSSSAATASAGGIVTAWETRGQIIWRPAGAKEPIAVPGNGGGRKHPSVAVNSAGYTLVAWTEGTGWQKGGQLAWQLYDPTGNPLPQAAGRQPGIPVWSFAAVVAKADGNFLVVY